MVVISVAVKPEKAVGVEHVSHGLFVETLMEQHEARKTVRHNHGLPVTASPPPWAFSADLRVRALSLETEKLRTPRPEKCNDGDVIYGDGQ